MLLFRFACLLCLKIYLFLILIWMLLLLLMNYALLCVFLINFIVIIMDYMPKIFKIIDSHWTCVNDSSLPCLADYLWSFGFDIPETIDYCLAHNDKYRLKFRRLGGKITIYINPQI